jgi:nucleoside-triphosphatase
LRKRILLLTGTPGVGKTTVVMKVVDSLRAKGYQVGGMVSREVRSNGVRVGFELIDLASGRSGWLARVDAGTGPSVGKYRVNLGDLESIGANAIICAAEKCEVVVIDEIGPMELFSESFSEAVQRAVNGAKLVIAVVHQSTRNNLIDSVKNRPDAELFRVTVDNRSTFAEVITKKAVLDFTSRLED